MKKIPTVFIREFVNHKIIRVTSDFTNEECKEAFLNGKATIKFDGSCCAIINGEFYKRYDAKKGKPIPEGAIKCQEEPDEVTGHLPCWVKVDENNPADKWFIKALNTYIKEYYKSITDLKEGTYEAVGEHFNGNPYKRDYDILVPHGKAPALLEHRTYEAVKEFLEKAPQEGLVFWLNDKPVCKIKKTDFGFEWPIRSRKDG